MALAHTAFTSEEMLHVLQAALPDRMVVFLDSEGTVLFRSNTLLGCENCTICNADQSVYKHSSCNVFEVFKHGQKSALGSLKPQQKPLWTSQTPKEKYEPSIQH